MLIRRDGNLEPFKSTKIFKALTKAASLSGTDNFADYYRIAELSNIICRKINDLGLSYIEFDELDNLIKDVLLAHESKLANAYIEYRRNREQARVFRLDFMKSVQRVGVQTDRDNANVGNNLSSKLLRIASFTNKYNNLGHMPKHLSKLFENGDLYYHDLDCFNLAPNCLHIPLGEQLEGGFNTGYGTLNEPNSILVAAELACILLQSSQNDLYGGQSFSDFENDLAPYVEKSRKKLIFDCLFKYQLTELGAQHLELLEEFITVNNLSLKDVCTIEDTEIYSEEFSNLITLLKNISENLNNMIDAGEHESLLSTADRLSINSALNKEVHQAMQTIVYNLNTMHSRAGSQVPFSSLNIGLPRSEDAALICRAFLEEYMKGLGKGEQPIFPNIIFRVKRGVNAKPGDPYYYLKKLACKVTAKRMNPTYMNMDASFNLKFYNQGVIPATMGCRTYLCSNVNGEAGSNKRGNNACTTMDLVKIALLIQSENKLRSSAFPTPTKEEVISTYFNRLDKMIDNASESLLYRKSILENLKVRDLPFVAGQGLMMGSEGLGQDDSIKPIIDNGTWGIGFIGLAETLKVLTGFHHGESEEARRLGYRIVKHIRERCDELTIKHHLNFSCYATPAEGLSSRFTDEDRKRFSDIHWIISKGYYTNSFHVPVDYKISARKKLEIEAPYHALCNGGHISYVELDDSPTGDDIELLLDGAYDTTDVSYIGFNFKLRYCIDCGHNLYSSEPAECPKCGSVRIQGISRVTGYLSLDERFGPGKVLERADRVTHEI